MKKEGEKEGEKNERGGQEVINKIKSKKQIMITYQKQITFETTMQIDFADITDEVRLMVAESQVRNGTVTVFAPHTTMGVVINHNEPMLLQDFARMFYRNAPVDERYSHDLFELRRDTAADGRSNGHSHCKSLLVGASEVIPIINGVLALSDIQSIFAVDFDGPRSRDVMVSVMGE